MGIELRGTPHARCTARVGFKHGRRFVMPDDERGRDR
jgi:hypothetical protein